jgi:hypothetical protein
MDDTAQIKFSADLSGLTDGLETASAGVSDFGDHTQEVLAAVAAAMANVGAPVAGLDRSFASLDAASQRLNQTIIEGNAKVADDQLKTQEALVQDQQKLGMISAADAIGQLEDLASQEHAINLGRIQDMTRLYAQTGDASGYVKMLDAETVENDRFTREVAQRQTEAAQESSRQWTELGQTITRTFDSAVDGIVRGTQTWQQSIRRAGSDVASEFVNNIVKSMVNSWVEGEVTKTNATIAGNALRTASSTSADQSTASSAANSLKGTVLNHAYSAAAAVYDDVTQIPYVGWVLAPAAAAAAFAAVAGFGVDINSAAGGFMVDQDQIMKVHENERVLPARYSAGLDAMVGNAAAGTTGGHTFNNTFHINASDGITARQIPAMIQAHLERSMRNGTFGGMRRA